MTQFSVSAILFDLDGVLIDSTPSVTRVWSNWALEHGQDPATVVKIAHGRRAIETVRLLAPHLDADLELKELERRELADTEGTLVIPGALQLLNSIPRNRWAVVTSGTRELATLRLSVGGLPVPEKLVSADDVVLGKPDPSPFLKGAEMLGFFPETCLVIEDSPSGITAAKAAGMRSLAVPTTYPADELRQADVLLKNLAQIRIEPVHNGRGDVSRLLVDWDTEK
jgi:mannitol-1-/sugar-/sorbitol-6-phosphatase